MCGAWGFFKKSFFSVRRLTLIFFEQFNELREAVYWLLVVRRPARFFIFSLASVGVDG
jgi:hypothetical protein